MWAKNSFFGFQRTIHYLFGHFTSILSKGAQHKSIGTIPYMVVQLKRGHFCYDKYINCKWKYRIINHFIIIIVVIIIHMNIIATFAYHLKEGLTLKCFQRSVSAFTYLIDTTQII